jgi:molecular chaperone GrpE
VLAEYRLWLEQYATTDVAVPADASDRPVDLAAIVDAFTSLRHEVHLQTKAARAQAEQTAAALAQTKNAMERPSGATPAPEQREWLENLIEAADALTRAHAGLQRAIAATQTRPGWRRWFHGSRGEDDALSATADGLMLGLQRFERLLESHGLTAIPAVGNAFDAESMEAVEVASSGGHEPGVVVDEVRRGYRRDGVVFRHALVKVSGPLKPMTGQEAPSP